jgi:hypothetical protein
VTKGRADIIFCGGIGSRNLIGAMESSDPRIGIRVQAEYRTQVRAIARDSQV